MLWNGSENVDYVLVCSYDTTALNEAINFMGILISPRGLFYMKVAGPTQTINYFRHLCVNLIKTQVKQKCRAPSNSCNPPTLDTFFNFDKFLPIFFVFGYRLVAGGTRVSKVNRLASTSNDTRRNRRKTVEPAPFPFPTSYLLGVERTRLSVA